MMSLHLQSMKVFVWLVLRPHGNRHDGALYRFQFIDDLKSGELVIDSPRSPAHLQYWSWQKKLTLPGYLRKVKQKLSHRTNCPKASNFCNGSEHNYLRLIPKSLDPGMGGSQFTPDWDVGFRLMALRRPGVTVATPVRQLVFFTFFIILI